MKTTHLPPKVTSTHVFFHGYEGPEPESTFQQWHPSSFVDHSTSPPQHFKTAEHYMMYQKAILMGDKDVADKVLAAETPAEAKTLGREVRPFKQKLWDANCDRVAEEGNYLKFSQNDHCKSALLDSGSRELVEASPSDRIWGIGFSADDAEGNESEWGKNKLGKALMRVRKRLGGA